MIKLRILLMEAIDIAKNRYSWLTPDGQFIPFWGASHAEYAQKSILKNQSKTVIEDMWKMGYMRVCFMGAVLMAHNEKMPPNEKQKQALIDLAVECGDAAVEYDYGDDYKVIWSINDTI